MKSGNLKLVLLFLCLVQLSLSLKFMEGDISEFPFMNSKFFSALKQFKNKHTEFIQESDNSNCRARLNKHYSEVFGFMPALLGSLKNVNEKLSFENECFEENEITLTELSTESSSLIIEINASKKKHPRCKHSYFIATTNLFDFQISVHNGVERAVFRNLTQDDFDEIRVNGIKIFDFCHGVFRSINDFIRTKQLFDKPHEEFFSDLHSPVPPEDENVKRNMELLAEYGFQFDERRNPEPFMLDPKLIKSGDLFTCFGLTGGHTFLMFFTGARTGHNAMAMWIKDELFILEASGIIHKVKYEEWVQSRIDDNYHITYHPLSEESRKKFNATATLEYFNTMENAPYGLKNLFFTYFDTTKNNLPVGYSPEIISTAMSVLEQYVPFVVKALIHDAFLMRLDIHGRNMTIPQITAEAARRGMTFEELFAMPEKEEYIYSNGPNYVCSSLVTKMWKVGGLFGDLNILPQEFTQRDNYQLRIFEEDLNKLPQECRAQDPDLPYCVLSGKYIPYLPAYNSIPPYEHMNERCPSSGPKFDRPEGC